MTTISYSDIGNLANARNNSAQVWTNLGTFGNYLFNSLRSVIAVDDNNPPVPKVNDTLAIYTPSGLAETSVKYTPGNGPFPVGNIRMYLGTPDGEGNVGFDFIVEFFDINRITVTADGVPSVTAKFDVTNIDAATFNLFVASVLGTAIPVWLDKLSDSFYNGTSSS